jgi:outer membrane protein assembly factor BamB
MLCRAALILAFFPVLATLAYAENWPQWRGPQANGISGETGLPHKWSKTENVVWRFPLPGPAGATPAVWEDRIFVSSADGKDLVLVCVGTDGKQLWKQKIGSDNRGVRGDEGNFASPSPTTDGKHVWTFVGSGELTCLTMEGKPVWRFNVNERYGKVDIQFGLTSTPLLDGDRLYLQLLHSRAALAIALDKATGKEIWKHNRTSDATAECEHSYASPVLYRQNGLELLLIHGGDYITAHRLDDGGEVWRCGGMNPKGNYNPTLRFIASPVAAPGLVVVPSAKNGPVLALDPASRGDISDSDQGHHWVRPKNTPDVPSPLVHEGLVYLCREDGTVLCLDAKTGKEHYAKNVHRDRYRASPIYADGAIWVTARDGTVSLLKPGTQFELLAQNTLGEPMTASPAISGGRVYLRTFDALYAVGKK